MKKKRLDVRTMAYLAMFIGLTTVLSLLGEFMPIQMPQGGSISLDVIAIFLCAYLLGTWEGVVCGVCVSILQFVLGIALYYGPWSVLLDYVLPLAVCGLASLIKIVRVRNVNLYLGVIMSMVPKYLCHFASGAFLFGSYAPEGMHPVIYSLGYNLPYNLATLVVAYIAVTLLYPVLHKALRFSK